MRDGPAAAVVEGGGRTRRAGPHDGYVFALSWSGFGSPKVGPPSLRCSSHIPTASSRNWTQRPVSAEGLPVG